MKPAPRPMSIRRGGFSRHEVLVQASFVAVALWTVAIVAIWLPAGDRDLFGRVKGTDFAHFYTIGHASRDGRAAGLYDAVALHTRQEQLVPASASDFYPFVYPPQMALAFLPLSALPYGAALAVWSVITGLVFAVSVRLAWQAVRATVPDGRLVFVAALGFAPFWNLVLHGQTTTFVLVGFTAAAWAIGRNLRTLAGVALGLLWMKPPFAPIAVLVLVVRREWRALAGLLVSVALQVAAASWVFGPGIWQEYAGVMSRFSPVQIEPKPGQLHSLKALTNLFPDPAGTVLWLVAASVTVWLLIRTVRAPVPPTVSLGLIVMATVLASPHLTIYDAAVLALPALWIGGWFEAAQPERARTFWKAMYWLSVAFLLPTAPLAGVQVSVLILAAAFWISCRAVAASARAEGRV